MVETASQEIIVKIMDEAVNLKEFLEAHKGVKKKKAKRAPKIAYFNSIRTRMR